MVAVGEILTGKVTGITKFGAFVSLPDGKSGLVHISEISNSFVSDIRSCLSDGQEVKVKVVSVDEKGRINLSIKRAAEPAPAPSAPPVQKKTSFEPPKNFEPVGTAPASDSFEDKLKAFMKASESKMSDIRSTAERKNSGRRRGR
ncbi:MAG: S1 RNA-binding domain-containing protein [Clostridia bacterium]|nr:S1 RNA-binding domain-containing protein [Clostridia bacterium]